jgi:hypothetical protein
MVHCSSEIERNFRIPKKQVLNSQKVVNFEQNFFFGRERLIMESVVEVFQGFVGKGGATWALSAREP